MPILRLALAKIRALFRRNAVAGEIREEMRFHLAMREDELQRRGLTADQARRAASRRFGNLTVMQDRAYGVRGGGVMETIMQDCRYAIRLAVRQPRFSALVILTIALAMGVSTALFTVADATLLRPLPYPHPEQMVDATVPIRFDGRQMFTSGAVTDMRRWQNSDVFSAVAAWHDITWGCILDGTIPERVKAREISDGYLAVYGAAPTHGRDFTIADTIAGAPQIVMLSHAYWQTRLGADPAAIGKIIRYDDVSAVLVGVLPAGFHPDVTLWRPIREDSVQIDRRGGGVSVYGRLRGDLGIEIAARRLSAITPVGDGMSAGGNGASALGAEVRLASVLEWTVQRYRTTVQMLAGAVALVVLMACVNIAGLLLARGATRETELAIRASMGAGRLRLVRQLLIESVLLSVVGGVVGAFVAWLSLDGLLAVLPITLPPGAAATIDLRVLAAVGILAVTTGIVFGLAPAIRLSRAGIHGAVARGTRRHGSALSRRGGQSLIATEVALAVVLVVGAGLMIRSFARLTSVDLGFDPESIFAFKAVPVEADPAVQARYYPELLQALRRIPGVAAAGAVDHFALGDSSVISGVIVNGKSAAIGIRQILPGYFEALGLPLRLGSLPSIVDDVTNRDVVVINESASRRLFPEGAIGQQLTRGTKALTVIGVVADFHHGGPLQKPQPEAFVPFEPANAKKKLPLALTLVIRSRGRVAGLADALRHAAESVGPRVIIEDVRSGADWLDDRVATPRHRTALLGLLGGFGLVLSLVGIFSMTAYAVARRTKEIGVRMALGARPRDVVGRMVRDAGWPTLIGLVGGLGAAYYATRVVQSFLFETTPHDPATFAVVALLTGVVAMLAAWIPARRAAYVDPVVALRAE